MIWKRIVYDGIGAGLILGFIYTLFFILPNAMEETSQRVAYVHECVAMNIDRDVCEWFYANGTDIDIIRNSPLNPNGPAYLREIIEERQKRRRR